MRILLEKDSHSCIIIEENKYDFCRPAKCRTDNCVCIQAQTVIDYIMSKAVMISLFKPLLPFMVFAYVVNDIILI